MILQKSVPFVQTGAVEVEEAASEVRDIVESPENPEGTVTPKSVTLSFNDEGAS